MIHRMAHPRRLVTLSSIRNRCEIRGIGFGENSILGNKPDQIVIAPLAKGDDSAERDIPAMRNCRIGKLV
jgi:hypothetical protein